MNQLSFLPITDFELKSGNYGVVLCSGNSIEPVLVSVSEQTAIRFMEVESDKLSPVSYYRHMQMSRMRDLIINNKTQGKLL